MNQRKSSFLKCIVTIILWISPIIAMIPNLFSSISGYEKIIIYSLVLITVTIIFMLVWLSFCLARKHNLIKRILPYSECNKCADLLCCLKVVRPGVNYKEDLFQLSSNKFIDEFELATLEAKLPLKEVWIISPDLSYECKETFFTEVVRRNIKSGVKYRFITQDCADSRENLIKIYDKYTNKFSRILYQKRLITYLVSASRFDMVLSLYSFVIYNPNPQKSKYESRIYICVGENGNEVHSVYKEIDNEHQVNITLDTVRSIIKSTKPYVMMEG